MKLSKRLEDAIDQWIENEGIDPDELIEYIDRLTDYLYQTESISFKVLSSWTESDGHFFQIYLPLPTLVNIPMFLVFNSGYGDDPILNFDNNQTLVQSLLKLERRAMLVTDVYNLYPGGGRYTT